MTGLEPATSRSTVEVTLLYATGKYQVEGTNGDGLVSSEVRSNRHLRHSTEFNEPDLYNA